MKIVCTPYESKFIIELAKSIPDIIQQTNNVFICSKVVRFFNFFPILPHCYKT